MVALMSLYPGDPNSIFRVASYVSSFFFPFRNSKSVCYFDFKTLFINYFNLGAQGCSLGFFFVTEIPADRTLLENTRELVSFFFLLMSKVNLKY